MTPRELVTTWVDIFNAADPHRLSELYHDDAVNHQVVQDQIKGKQHIYKMFKEEFEAATMTCIVENIFEEDEWAILEWKDPLGLRGCGFFHVIDGKIKFQRGYWDKLSFLRMHNLPIPTE